MMEIAAVSKWIWRKIWPILRHLSVKWFRFAVDKGPHGIARRYLYGR